MAKRTVAQYYSDIGVDLPAMQAMDYAELRNLKKALLGWIAQVDSRLAVVGKRAAPKK